MKLRLLASLKGIDFGYPAGDYAGYRLRPAARAVIFDGSRVGLLRVGKHGYYMLPGGGIDPGEDPATALAREIREEIGCTVQMRQAIGMIETYIDRWKNRQIDTCFVGDMAKAGAVRTPTDFEHQEQHEVVWAASLAEAIMLMEQAHPDNADGALIRARDLLFLQTAAAMQVKTDRL